MPGQTFLETLRRGERRVVRSSSGKFLPRRNREGGGYAREKERKVSFQKNNSMARMCIGDVLYWSIRSLISDDDGREIVVALVLSSLEEFLCGKLLLLLLLIRLFLNAFISCTNRYFFLRNLIQ